MGATLASEHRPTLNHGPWIKRRRNGWKRKRNEGMQRLRAILSTNDASRDEDGPCNDPTTCDWQHARCGGGVFVDSMTRWHRHGKLEARHTITDSSTAHIHHTAVAPMFRFLAACSTQVMRLANITRDQVVSRSTRSSAGTCLPSRTPPRLCTACASLPPTMLSPSPVTGTSCGV